MAWLQVTPKTADDKPGSMTRAQMIARDGGTLGLPDIDAPHLAGILSSAGMCINSGMGIAPLPPSELSNWAALTSTPLAPWEAQAVLSASRAYVSEFYADNPSPPWGHARDMADPDVVADRIRTTMTRLSAPTGRRKAPKTH